MKAEEPLAELPAAPEDFTVFLEESWHLPPPGDQSWRETDALRIFGAPEKSREPEKTEPAETKSRPMPTDFVPEREFAPDWEPPAQGWGGVVAALFLVPVVILVIAVLAFPGILTGEFRRAPQTMVRPPAVPAQVAKASAPVPAPPRPAAPGADPASKGVLVIDAAPKPQAAPPVPAPAEPDKTMAQPPQPAATDNSDLNGQTGAVADATSSSRPLPRRHAVKRLAARHMANERDTGGFYAMVAGPDGTLRYQYFPSRPEH